MQHNVFRHAPENTLCLKERWIRMPSAKVTVNTISSMKQAGTPIAMVTAYDYTMAKIISNTEIDMILVGDSLGNVMLGYPSTVPVTLEEMIHHASAVVRGNGNAMVVCDMPFMSYQVSHEEGMRSAGRIMKETLCDAVKLEGGSEVAPLVRKMVSAGIPVVGHIGLTPQYANVLGGYKVQGKNEQTARKLIQDALALEEAGAFAIVLECVPAKLAELITSRLHTAASIGIGGGAGCDGQVLVCMDLLGMTQGHVPKFVKNFAGLNEIMTDAFNRYSAEVKSKKFPAAEHSFNMNEDILSRLQ